VPCLVLSLEDEAPFVRARAASVFRESAIAASGSS